MGKSGKYGGLVNYGTEQLIDSIGDMISSVVRLRHKHSGRVDIEHTFHETWFSCAIPYSVTADSGDLSFTHLKAVAPTQLATLAEPLHADRATLDDSYAYRRYTDTELATMNLANIMSSPEDIVFVSSNHAFIHMPNRPSWVEDDYIHSLQLVLIFKVLLCRSEAHFEYVISSVWKNRALGSRKAHKIIVSSKSELNHILNATNPGRFTKYYDHAKFIEQLNDRTQLNQHIEVARDKLNVFECIAGPEGRDATEYRFRDKRRPLFSCGFHNSSHLTFIAANR